MKLLVEFLPILVLFGLYKAYDIKIATAGFMVSLIIMLLWKYYQTRKWDKFLLATSAIGLVLGSATIILNNPLFIQHKPTAVYGLLAIFFWLSYAFFNKNWIALLYSKVVKISSKTAKLLLTGTILFFLFMLIVNLILVNTVSFDLWITIKTWGFLFATIVFAFWQGYIIYQDQQLNEQITKDQT